MQAGEDELLLSRPFTPMPLVLEQWDDVPRLYAQHMSTAMSLMATVNEQGAQRGPVHHPTCCTMSSCTRRKGRGCIVVKASRCTPSPLFVAPQSSRPLPWAPPHVQTPNPSALLLNPYPYPSPAPHADTLPIYLLSPHPIVPPPALVCPVTPPADMNTGSAALHTLHYHLQHAATLEYDRQVRQYDTAGGLLGLTSGRGVRA